MDLDQYNKHYMKMPHDLGDEPFEGVLRRKAASTHARKGRRTLNNNFENPRASCCSTRGNADGNKNCQIF